MASKISIWNRALQKVGSEELVDPNANNKRTRALSRAYTQVRDALLEQYPWTFAKRLVVLSSDGAFSPEWKYASQYLLPEDALAVLEVHSTDPYEVIQPKYDPSNPSTIPSRVAIATNHTGPLEVLYISRVTNEGIYSPLFCEYFAAMLAYEVCEELTQSNAKKEALSLELHRLERQAKNAHSKQRTPQAMRDGSWWEARF